MPEQAADFNHNQPVYTVSEISAAVKRVLEDHFGVVRLKGEVSGWKGPHSSGHAYFSLKDENAVIGAVCWRGTLAKLQHRPEEGLEVIATGRISAYNGKYQIVVEQIEPAGLGALMALLEKRKKQLEAEGLFDPKRKKPLPFLPAVVGVITSPTGAVIRDILHRLEDRFPAHVLVWPVAVQGEGAKEQIAEAIKGFNLLPPAFSAVPPSAADISFARNARGAMERGSRLAQPAGFACRPDVIIVARGGGSIEDLWAFNEEIVVRAAAASKIPLISAVGHETDTTLIDFAADRRAPTPTAAAEMAVPVREELLSGVHELAARLKVVASRLFETSTQQLDGWSERLLAALPLMIERKTQTLAVLVSGLKPRLLFSEIGSYADKISDLQKRMHLACQFEDIQQRLDHYTERLAVSFPHIVERKTQQLTIVANALRPRILTTYIDTPLGQLGDWQKRMNIILAQILKSKEEKLMHLAALLESVNYQRVLERGFALVRDEAGKLVSSVKTAAAKKELRLTFRDGDLKVKT